MLAMRNLFRQKTRSLLTLFGIVIGIAAVVSLGAAAGGMAEGYSMIVGGRGQADLVVMQEGSFDLMMSVVDESVARELAAMPEVRSVSRMLYSWIGAGEALYMGLFGYDPEEEAIGHFRVVEGEPLGGRGHDVLLGRLAARNLKKQVGDSISVLSGSYRIVGLYETGDTFTDMGMVVTVETAQAMLGRSRQVSSLLLRLRSPDDEAILRQRMERRFPDLSISRTSEFGDQAMMITTYRAMGWGIALLAVIIGGVTMANTLIMSVYERTSEVGVLRAIGWRRARVMRMFLGESLLLAVVGGALGVGLGALLAWAASYSPAFGAVMNGRVTPDLVAQGMGVALVMGIVGGTLPAWRAAHLTPLEALRYEGGSSGQALGGGALVRRMGRTVRSLLRRRTRTLLTIAGTTIGIAAIVSLQIILDGTMGSIEDLFGGAELVAAQADVSDTSFSSIDELTGRRIAAMPGVRYVEGAVLSAITVPRQGFLMMMGVHPAGEAVKRYHLVEGEPLSGNRDILLGRTAAANLKKSVGETIRLTGTTFRIVGIYETGLNYEDGGAIITLRQAQRLFGKPRQVTWLTIKVDDPARVEQVRDEIQAAFPELNVALSTKFFDNSTEMEATNGLMGMISSLALLVGGLGMMNTMVMSVLERTRELGLLRAIGWRRRRVLWLVMRESLVLGLIGGVAGLATGVLLAWALTLSPITAAFVELAFTPKLFVMSLAIAVGLGALGGLYPAWRATRMSPIEALRYE